MKPRFFIAVACAGIVISFQNCSKVNFSTIEASLPEAPSTDSPLSITGSATTDTLVATNMNTPVDFEVIHSISMSGMQISIAALDPNTALNGQFEILSIDDFKLKYTPNWGFRGKDFAVATVKDTSGHQLNFNIIVTVGNALHTLEPALAVRGVGCLQCHANVSSNIITDFGYKNDYYFSLKPANSWWKSGGVYGDHGNNVNTIAIPSDKFVIVPKADLPVVVAASAQNLATLADYIKSQFSKSAFASTTAAQVVEKSSVYIGAPTASDISSAFKLADSDRIKYFKNSDSSLALSGLKDEKTFFKNEGVLNCEGDLAIRGPLLLDNLQVNSKTGCRLYVIGSVFMYGEITYLNKDEDRNLQITSTKSISLGLGSVKKDTSFCDPKDRYATNTAGYGTSSLTNRYVSFWTVPGNYVRQSSDPKAFGQSIVDEATLIEAKAGILYDAVCRAEGRKVSFERIILNAPIVQSRYQGNVSGTIIAEFSIMSLGAFKFSFDQVFTRVSVFPFLDKSTYLDVKN
jgi:hypothetical protein